MKYHKRCSSTTSKDWSAGALCFFSFFVLTLFFTSVEASPAARLFSRSTGVCGGKAGLELCSNDLPADWCCSASTKCLSLNNTGTKAVICCPSSSPNGCQTVQPISCDIKKQNATANPDSQLFTEDLTRKLPSCGAGTCCPLGFSCKDGQCLMNEETKRAAEAHSSITSSSSSSTTATKTSGGAPTATISSGATTLPPGPVQTSNLITQTPTPETKADFPVRAVLAGLFPGIIIGSLLCGIVFFWLRRRSAARVARAKHDSEASNPPMSGPPKPGPKMRTISEPIQDPQLSIRTHFRKTPDTSLGATIAPITPRRTHSRRLSQRLRFGTWDTVTTLPKGSSTMTRSDEQPQANMTPIRTVQYTPTPKGRNLERPEADFQSVADAASPTRSVARSLKPLSPLLPAFDRGTPRSQLSKASIQSRRSNHFFSPANIRRKVDESRRSSRSRSRSWSRSVSTITTFSNSSSTASKDRDGRYVPLKTPVMSQANIQGMSPPSRHDTSSSSQTVNFLLSTSAEPFMFSSELFNFQEDANSSQQDSGFITPPRRTAQSNHRRQPSQRSLMTTPRASNEQQSRPVLGSPWQHQQSILKTPSLGVVPESPASIRSPPSALRDARGGGGGGGERDSTPTSYNEQRMTTFTTLMFDAGYGHGSPAKAVRWTSQDTKP